MRASLHDDLVTPVPVAGDDTVTVQRALTGGGDEPKVFYLRYADGTEQHTANYDACTGKVPKFECTFAPTLLECQRQIQAYLDEVVRRLQHHLHADAADERQVLHRGRVIGRRRLVQGR